MTLRQKNSNLGRNLNCMRYKLHICHAYSTNEALSNVTKVNDLVTLTFILKIANFGLCCCLEHSCFTNTPIYFYFVACILFDESIIMSLFCFPVSGGILDKVSAAIVK